MKIVLCGYSGKVGSAIYQLLAKNNDITIFGADEYSASLKQVLANNKIEIVIDFTNAIVSYKNILYCIQKKIEFISGTTGFSKYQLNYIKKRCRAKKVKGAICPNFSIPVNLMFSKINELSKQFAKVEYFECHHKSKKDLPSGTAKIFSKLNRKIIITSLLSNDYTIDYKIIFSSLEHKLVINYSIYDKIVYARGLLYYLESKSNIVYNLLNENNDKRNTINN